jgi:2-(1,2-epoxy-1,2-dihydrophenyl)acetyl-CoA isomerase
MSDVVLTSVEDAVMVITMNRPESLNAMTPEMLDTLADVAAKAAADPAIRCVVITGAGRAFCAGGDVKAMAAANEAAASSGGGGGLVSRVDVLRQQEEVSRLLHEMPKPTIAAVNGVAAGAGLSVALAADLRIASDQARFTTAFAKVGFSGDFGGTWLLPPAPSSSASSPASSPTTSSGPRPWPSRSGSPAAPPSPTPA